MIAVSLSRSIGSNIKKLRVKQGLTQDELAQALFVTRQTVSNYETGRSNPDVDMLQRISEVLHTDINYLLYGDLLFAERRLLRKRTFKIITVFCAFLILMLVFYPLTLSLKTNKYEFMPYMLVRIIFSAVVYDCFRIDITSNYRICF